MVKTAYGVRRTLQSFFKEYSYIINSSVQLDVFRDNSKYRWVSVVEKKKVAPRIYYKLWCLQDTPKIEHEIILSSKGVIVDHLNEKGERCKDKKCSYLLSCYEYAFLREQKSHNKTLTGWKVIGSNLCVNIYQPINDRVYIKFKTMNALTGSGSFVSEEIYNFTFAGMGYEEFLIFVKKKCPTIAQFNRYKETGFYSQYHYFEKTCLENEELLKAIQEDDNSKLNGVFKFNYNTLLKYKEIFKTSNREL